MAPLLAGVIGDTWAFFADGDHWRGPQGIPTLVGQHVEYSAIPVAVALAIALPVGVALGHTGRGGNLVIAVANVARAVPSFGLVVLGLLLARTGVGPALVALVVLCVPPVLVNACYAVRGVDADLKEAARGQGMTGWQVLRRVELPSAVPLLMAGVRNGAVLVVATAGLASFVPGVGGLGRYVVDGFFAGDQAKLVAGGLLIALLAGLTEAGLALAQRALTPSALRRRRRDAASSEDEVPVLAVEGM